MSENNNMISGTVETITPEIAAEMLAENTNNRNISRVQLDLFTRTMEQGGWRMNGEAIKFSDTGRLLDGQHRLMACQRSGVPFTTLVIRGLPEETQQTMDSGKTRSLGNVLELRGETNCTQLATVARSVYIADQLGLETALIGNIRPTRVELLDFIDRTPQLHVLLSASSDFQARSGGLLSHKLFAALWWTFAHKDLDETNQFFEQLASGAGLDASSPILLLRNKLFEMKSKGLWGTREASRRIGILTVSAWNKYRRHETVTVLRAGDTFPEPL